MKRILYLAAAGCMLLGSCSGKQSAAAEEEINDSKTPLHLLRPDYAMPYGVLDPDTVKADVDRVFAYVESVTPAKVVDENGNTVEDLTNLPDSAELHKGTYRLTSYEWGVAYMAMLDAAEAFGDPKYRDYVIDRVGFLGKAAPGFTKLAEKIGKHDSQMRQVVAPASLDDAGAMSAAFMRAHMADSTLAIGDIIERYYDILETKTLRLPDGTIARNRPHHNAVWLDDMFMAIPAMAARAEYTGDRRPLDEAAKAATGFFSRMWIPEKGLFRHGYVEGLEVQPEMAWGRANGWAILAMSQLLDALPEDHPQRKAVLDTFKAHARTLARTQSTNGFWHQLLDRPETYEETSATAIFAYCLAHGVNKGWLDARTYGPVAQLAWEAVSTKINEKGEVEDVCVGTGMGFDPAYYAYRPVSVKAAHGYGPVIWAGAEVAKMLKDSNPRVNDSAVHYYQVDPEATTPIFSLDENGKAIEILH